MSICFESNDGHELWNPATQVGSVFIEIVHSIERVFGVSSGIGSIVSDEVVVEPMELREFFSVILDVLGSNHPINRVSPAATMRTRFSPRPSVCVVVGAGGSAFNLDG